LQCRFRICSDALVTIIKILLDLLGTVFGKEKRVHGKREGHGIFDGVRKPCARRKENKIIEDSLTTAPTEVSSKTLIRLPTQAEKLPSPFLSLSLLVIFLCVWVNQHHRAYVQ
jgi:hypothetical protein